MAKARLTATMNTQPVVIRSPLSVEEYARRRGRLHPDAVAFLQQYFDEENHLNLHRVRVNVKHDRTAFLNVSAWVMRDLIIVRRGRLNANAMAVPQAIDLATVSGMRVLAHECYHVRQWLTRPWWKMVAIFVADVARSLYRTRRLWSHADSKLEQEAIEFVKSITPDMCSRTAELKIFKVLR